MLLQNINIIFHIAPFQRATTKYSFIYFIIFFQTKSTASLVQQGKISITSCSVGDAVLVIWNVEHANYTILQENSTLFFLHSDCLDILGLRPSSDGSPRRLYSTAQVVEKEYCHAKKVRKNLNRFFGCERMLLL